MTELWGLGDFSLAVPFLRMAARHARVTVLAQPRTAALLARFAPETALVALSAPWTAFRGKYRLHAWPWRQLTQAIRTLRAQQFDVAVSARPDPRDHALMFLAGAKTRLGFPRAGSRPLLTRALPRPPQPHRAEHWRALASALGWPVPDDPLPRRRPGRRIVIHTGAAQPTRRWPRERFEEIAARLRTAGWDVTVIDESHGDLPALLDQLDAADRFIGNDSGPGHFAALLGVPTFTVFGPVLPSHFAPQHPLASWIEGAPCRYKPCFDSCRFAEPHCILALDVDTVWSRLQPWLARPTAPAGAAGA
ncbi:MAG TPA: glycosyltransferase family 9 protein [Opitutus sp.]|nr:glycosyltransferase family 9 protein [Opitutus sp.]